MSEWRHCRRRCSSKIWYGSLLLLLAHTPAACRRRWRWLCPPAWTLSRRIFPPLLAAFVELLLVAAAAALMLGSCKLRGYWPIGGNSVCPRGATGRKGECILAPQNWIFTACWLRVRIFGAGFLFEIRFFVVYIFAIVIIMLGGIIKGSWSVDTNLNIIVKIRNLVFLFPYYYHTIYRNLLNN